MTTLPEGFPEEGPQGYLTPREDAWQEITGIPVRIVSTETERDSPEFGSWMTFTIGQAGLVSASPYCTQLLQRRYRRYKAKFGPCVFGTGTTSVVVNSKPDPLTIPVPQGWIISATNLVLPDYDAEQPLYAIAIGGIATIPVLDESYGYKRSE